MTGFVGAVAVGAQPALVDRHVFGLGRAYEQIRGHAARQDALREGVVGVIAFSRSADPSVVDTPDRWTAVTGRAHGGERFAGDLRTLEGQYALASFDRTTGTLTVATDPFGMQPVYAAEVADVLLFSTSALALARHLGATPSRSAMCAFLRIGMVFGSHSLWEGIRSLPAGSAWRCSRARVEVASYYDFEVRNDVRGATFPAAVEQACALVVDACSRLEPAGNGGHPSWADLTGGFDTRVLCAAFGAAGIPIAATTTGAVDDRDVRIGARVAAAAGLDWTRITIPDEWEQQCLSYFDAAVAWGDGALPMLHLGEVLYGHEQKAMSSTHLFNGGGFEHAQSFAWSHDLLHNYRRARADERAVARLRWIKPLDQDAFTHDFTAPVIEELASALDADRNRHPGDPRRVQLERMLLFRDRNHFGAFTGAARRSLDMEMPGFTKQLFEFLCSLPTEFRRAHRLHRAVITQLAPDLARLPTTSGGPAVPIRLAQLPRFAPYATDVVRRGVLKLPVRYERLHADVGGLAACRRAAARRAFESLELDTRAGQCAMRTQELVAPDRLPALLERVLLGSQQAAKSFDRILTLERALQMAGNA